MKNKKVIITCSLLFFAFFMSFVILAFSYIRFTQHRDEQAREQLNLKAQLFNMRSLNIYNVLERFYSHIKLKNTLNRDLFNQYAYKLLKDYPEIQMIDWVDDKNIITLAASTKNNPKMLGLDVETEDKLYRAIMHGKVTRSPFVTGPLQLVGSQAQAIVIFPVFQSNIYNGALLAAIQLDQILDYYPLQNLHPKLYHYTLSMDGHVLRGNDSATNTSYSPLVLTQSFPLLGHQFKLNTQVYQGYFNFKNNPLIWSLMALLIILFLLIGGSLYLLISNWRDSRKLSQLQAQMEKCTHKLLLIEDKYKSLQIRYHSAVESAKIGIWVWEIDTDKLTWNHIMYHMYDVPRDAFLTYKTWYNKVLEEDRKRADSEVKAAIHGAHPFDTSFKIYSDDGIKVIKASGVVSRNEDGSPYMFTGMNVDITQTAHFEAILAKSEMAFFEVNLKKSTISFSDSAGINLGIVKNIKGHYPLNKWVNDISAEHRKTYVQHIFSDQNQSVTYEYQIYDGNNRQIWLQDMIIKKIFPHKNNQDGIIIGYTQNISDRKKKEYKKLQLASHDTLTTLPNLYLVQEKLKSLTYHTQRGNDKFALLYLDIDNLKSINDNFGHNAGNEALEKISLFLKKSLRKSDFVGRIGGDELLIIITQVKDIDFVDFRINEILNGVRSLKFSFDPQCPITASIGVALYPDDAKNIDTLVDLADKAMYRAKKCGKNRVVFYKDIS